jgi:hypothetical protein
MALSALRGATGLPGAALAHHTRAAIMIQPGHHPHRRGAMGPWRSHKRARRCHDRLTGYRLPAHDTPAHPSWHRHPPKAYAPLQDGSKAVVRPLASPLPPSCAAPLCFSVQPPSHCHSKAPTYSPRACSTQDCVAAGRHTNSYSLGAAHWHGHQNDSSHPSASQHIAHARLLQGFSAALMRAQRQETA